MRTLDYLAAKTAREIVEGATQSTIGADAKDLENLITKALGVLQSQGVYALYLYLYSQSGTDKPIKRAAAHVVTKLWNALKEEPVSQLSILANQGQINSWGTALARKQHVLRQIVDRLTTDLDTLLLVRDLYEQTLIYARYHAKALGGS